MKTKQFRSVKSIAIICMLLCFALSLGVVFKLGTPVQAENTASDTAIRVYIDTTSEQFKTEYPKAGSNETKYIFGVSPFPAMSADGYSLIFKNNAIPNWWNAWGDIEFSYDFYSPNFLPGMAGLGFTYNAAPWASKAGDFSDSEGFASVCYDDQFVAKFKNGWCTRTFNISLTAETGKNPRDPYFLFAVDKKDVPTTGVIEFYIDNVKVKVNGVTYNLYGGENAIFNDEGVNATAKGEAYGDFSKKYSYFTSWDAIKAMTGATTACNVTLGAQFEATATPEIKVEEEGEELLPGEKAINLSIDTQSAAFAEGISGLNPTDSVAFAFMPFPCLNNTQCSIKNDYFTNWWNGFGNLEISYDVYSDTFIPGMDGIATFIDASPWIMSNTDYTDEVGNNSTVQTAESSKYYENGWRRRIFNVTIPSGVNIEHIGFVFCAKTEDLPTTGIINIYYKNITLKFNGNTYNVYGQVDENNNEVALFTAEHVNKTANGEAIGSYPITKRIWNSEYGTMKTFTGVGSMRANTLGASFKAVNAFDLVSITTNAPEDVVSDGVYDLASFATSSATVAVDSIIKDGEAVDLSSVNVNAFTFTAGEWEIVYKAVGETNTAVARINLRVLAVPENNVTFVYNNGTANYTYTVLKDEKIVRPEADPTRVGYVFSGWVNENGEAFDFDAVYNRDVTIYATYAGLENTSAIRFYIDTNSDEFKTGIAKANTDETKFIFGVSPFPGVNDSGASLKNNAITNWWNAWGETEFSYDFWAPDYKPGMSGIGLMYDHSPWFSMAETITDTNGRPNVCYDDGFTKELGNGWYNRTLKVDINGTNPRDVYFLFAVEKGNIPTTGILEFYITNVTVKVHGVTFKLFGGEDAIYNEEGVNCVAEGKPYNGFSRQTDVWMTSWGTIRDMTNSGTNACNVTLGAKFEAVQAPDVTSVSVSVPEILYTETGYNLTEYANGAEVYAISNENGEVNVEGADFTNYSFSATGKWQVTYAATKNGYVAKKTVEFVVSDINMPVLLDADVALAIPETGYAHKAIELGNVFASVQGEKNLKAVPYVTNDDGEVFAVTETETGWTFVPTAKVNAVYTVVYKAENSAGVVVSNEYYVTVTDIDKPVIDFTYLDGFFIGSFYEIEKVIALIDITDISDGIIGVASISIVDPFGNELVTDGAVKFMAPYSGKYRVTIVSEADSDGNVTEASADIVSRQTEGLVLAVEVAIDEASRAEGVEKTFDTQIFHPGDCTLNVGDKIVYDVMAYTVYEDGTYGFIPGLGAITGQMGGSWEMMYNLFERTECFDEQGYSMARTADLSAVLKDENNMPVWYTRTYKVTSGDAVYGQVLYHFAVGFSTTAACGEKIVVMYRNARIYDAEGNVKTLLWNGVQEINRSYTHGTVSGNAYATYDVSPVPVDGKIPTTAVYGEYISISKNLMKDASIDEAIPSTVRIVSPSGQDVAITETATGYEFVIEELGTFTVYVSATNNKGYTTYKQYVITVADTVRPTIKFEQDSENYYIGDTVTIDIEIEDDIFDYADFIETGCTITFDGMVVDGAVQATENGFTVTFVGELGEYSILVYATDGARNETVEVKTITVTEKPVQSDSESSSVSESPSDGCVAGVGISTFMAIVGMLSGAALIGLKRKNNR